MSSVLASSRLARVQTAAAQIAPAQGARDLDVVRALFREYEQSVDAAQCFAGFEDELAGLPGDCAAPLGGILLAHDPAGAVIGVVAFHPLAPSIVPGVAEMKRLYVRPAYRGLGIGRDLVASVRAAAARGGHRQLRLSTLPRAMPVADAMYRGLGFRPIAKYDGAGCGATCYEIAL